MRRTQTGLSLVELMIGLALGLFVTAAALTAFAGQWREHRHATLAMRLQQELRSTAELIARDLRRAGHWGSPSAAAPNPYAAFSPAAAASDAARYAYSRDATENQSLDGTEQFGLRVRRGVLELQIGASGWQALTNTGTLVVTEFSIVPRTERISLLEHCAHPCPPGVTCDVHVSVRLLALHLAARAADDPTLLRRVDTVVRLRNDDVTGACPA